MHNTDKILNSIALPSTFDIQYLLLLPELDNGNIFVLLTSIDLKFSKKCTPRNTKDVDVGYLRFARYSKNNAFYYSEQIFYSLDTFKIKLSGYFNNSIDNNVFYEYFFLKFTWKITIAWTNRNSPTDILLQMWKDKNQQIQVRAA